MVGATKQRLIRPCRNGKFNFECLAALPGMVFFGFVYDWTGSKRGCDWDDFGRDDCFCGV